MLNCKWNVKDVRKNIGSEPLLNGDFTFLEDYKKEPKKYDSLFFNMFMPYYLRPDTFNDDENAREMIVDFTGWINAMLTWNEYKYNKLYNTLLLTYDPISNYDMTETSKDSNTHEDSTNVHVGAINNTTSNTTGEQVSTSVNAYGDEHVNTVNGVSPEDIDGFVNADNSTATSTKADDSNTTTSGARTDTSINKTDSRTDDTYAEGRFTNDHTLTRKGNIGVTTSQQMLESEREVADFNFYEIVFSDIARQFLILNDEGVRIL